MCFLALGLLVQVKLKWGPDIVVQARSCGRICLVVTVIVFLRSQNIFLAIWTDCEIVDDLSPHCPEESSAQG